MNQTKLAAAQEDHAAKVQAVTDAEAALEQAAAAKVLADEKTMSVDADQLDKAIQFAATAAAKVEVLGRKLAVARDRAAQAELAVKAASVEAARVELADAESRLAGQDENVVQAVRDALAAIANPLADLLAARDHRNGIVSQLTGLGAIARAADPGAASRALKVGVPDTKTALAKIRAGEVVEPSIHAADTVTSLISWLAGEGRRAVEAKAEAEARQLQKARQHRLDGIAGLRGEAERDAALLLERQDYARHQGGTPSDPTLLGSDFFARTSIEHRQPASSVTEGE